MCSFMKPCSQKKWKRAELYSPDQTQMVTLTDEVTPFFPVLTLFTDA